MKIKRRLRIQQAKNKIIVKLLYYFKRGKIKGKCACVEREVDTLPQVK